MDAYNYSDNLIKLLQSSEAILKISKEFNDLKDNNERIIFAENLLKEHNFMPNIEQYKLVKSNKKADEFRSDVGNRFYKEKKFEEALLFYNKSLCFSTKDSPNLGINYANRSAVYFEMGYFKKSLENTRLAIANHYPKDKLEKMKKREEQCLEKIEKFPDCDEKFTKYEKAREKFLKPKLPGNKNFDFYVADCIKLKKSEEFGRFIVSNENLSVGTVLAIEQPFSKIVVPGARYERCANCLARNMLDLLPCNSCCSVMFCSEECRKIGNEKFHKYECGLVTALDELFSKTYLIALRTFFEALDVFKTPAELKEFLDSIKDSNSTIMDFTYTDPESQRKNALHSLDALVTVEKSPFCTVSDLFQRSNVCAILCNIMLNHSPALKSILQTESDKKLFRTFIFKQTQISAMNYHGLNSLLQGSIEQKQFGSASLPFCSLINHSCAPNVVRVSFGTNVYVITNRTIKKGEQIFDNYGFHHCLETLAQRQKFLFEQYRFVCACEACKQNYPLFSDLPIKNQKLRESFTGDFDALTSQDLEKAMEKFDFYCNSIDRIDKNYYPCHEISALQEMILHCLLIFIKNDKF